MIHLQIRVNHISRSSGIPFDSGFTLGALNLAYAILERTDETDKAFENAVYDLSPFENPRLDVQCRNDIVPERVLPAKIEVIDQLVELFLWIGVEKGPLIPLV